MADAPAMRLDAREQIPPSLIGAWKLSAGESRFPEGKAPRMQYRIFDYTEQGMLLVDYLTMTANGTLTSGNWTSAFDGSFRPEYMRPYGATPFAMVRLVKADDHTMDLVAMKNGVVFETGRLVIAPDGKTLTFTYQAGGKTSVAVYHPWDLIH
ncbi:hypothetical protein [Acetobacter fallax]|uniref:hypothetical protein n=1 Tax=Acetobacter fallax TaxID=1737473 RepID=UPI001A03B9AD|nr:hypothetical protein [Acetobacter fallax]NHO36106.1 hypothetical protein [Acetobacter fallax]